MLKRHLKNIEKAIENIHLYVCVTNKSKYSEEFKKEFLDILHITKQGIEKFKEQTDGNKQLIVAMYGETNAGKSTIIEILRSYFKEESKQEAREKFHAIFHKDPNNKELSQYEDGAIIGNGSSDFTRKVQEYTLKISKEDYSNKIILLDVPGIEGSEKEVEKEIKKALKEAHCILYVKKDPTPPQSADGKSGGTIGKIKTQLNDQAEVWTIFNKPIANPRMKMDIREDEQKALEMLDKKLKETLGEYYKGRKNISAQMGFYAQAECLYSEQERNNQAKFLNKYQSKEKLFKQSLCEDLVNFLKNELTMNIDKKFQQNELIKLEKYIENHISGFEIMKQNTKKLDELLQGEWKRLKNNLNCRLSEYKQKNNNIADKCLSHWIQQARKDIYHMIDKKDLSDQELTKQLETYFKGLDVLSKDINQALCENFKNYQVEIKADIQNFERRLGYIKLKFESEACHRINKKTSCDIETSWGIDVSGLLGSLITFGTLWFKGSAILAFGTILGPVTVGVICLTGIIGIINSVWNIFDTSYKKSEQKKCINELLRDIEKKNKKNLADSLQQFYQKMKNYQKEIKINIKNDLNQIKNSIELIDSIQQHFKLIRSNIQESRKRI